MTIRSDAREAETAAFLAAHGLADAAREPLAGDASARRYERLRRPDGSTLILVDTPVPAEDLVPFVAIGAELAAIGLSVPAILAADVDRGLALQEDFGNETFSRLLAGGADPRPLYALATDALIVLHRGWPAGAAPRLRLPAYDAALFVEQTRLFLDAYCPVALGRPLNGDERSGFETAWSAVLEPVCAGAPSLLLRDYHVDNLMRLPRPGTAAAGLIDFQSAGWGPRAYDLVSLLEDARRDVAPDLAEAMAARYLAAFPETDADTFRRAMAVLGAARHTRIVAIFVRLAVTQGRRSYLVHLPRVWRLLEAQLAKPALGPVAAWFDRHLPPAARAAFVVPETT
ncbi:aminoglycoside phosphotransferase family protein [Azospirillum picis]|uniref:Aminoglycoside/choline kinase family phosphotransferase n=1 Tax=Azospirillum picis TaxID=488438 RepID=A0ABU0MUV2_9PROT|nr:phosphotransferase [Azospirillum picis]MBP2301888.1 aminoglycoside/choline kinase family phosphotransferase [Azospirillum picis]MDQ0537240.1 aminoglycoside/choline kinase family phosphotransferase [Azospirillum picis]